MTLNRQTNLTTVAQTGCVYLAKFDSFRVCCLGIRWNSSLLELKMLPLSSVWAILHFVLHLAVATGWIRNPPTGPLCGGYHHRGDDRQEPRAAAGHGGHLPHYALRAQRRASHQGLPVAAQDAVQGRARLLHRRWVKVWEVLAYSLIRQVAE